MRAGLRLTGSTKSSFTHDARGKQFRFLPQSLCLIGKSLFKGLDWIESLSPSHAPLLKIPAPFQTPPPANGSKYLFLLEFSTHKHQIGVLGELWRNE
jgi:hypothetical protein